MIVGGNQHVDLNYKIKHSELKYSLSYTIGLTATNSEHGYEKQVILLKISNSWQLIGHTHL